MIQIAFVTSSLENGGVTNVLLHYAQYLNGTDYHAAVISYSDNAVNHQAFMNYGADVFICANPQKKPQEFSSLLGGHHFDIVHCCTAYNSGIVLEIAARQGIKCRIAHSHASKNYRSGLVYRCYENHMRKKIQKYATGRIACSNEAGRFLFGTRDFEVLPNAVEAEQYTFREDARREIRTRFHVAESTIVIGNVGMFSLAKNQCYLVNVMKELLASGRDVRLMLVGDGMLKDAFLARAKECGIADKVIITGWAANANEYYSAFDVLALPSVSEGFPLAVLEAYANGLFCVASSNVTESININNHAVFLPIDEGSAALWSDRLMMCAEKRIHDNLLQNTVYDLKNNILLLESIYSRQLGSGCQTECE
jgi:glycosyltransferase involved in cell wall biosynthesis